MTPFLAGLSGQSTLIVLAILMTALLIVAMGAVTWSFDLRRSRLPQATAWEDLNQRLVALAGQFSEKQAELQEIKRQIQERDQVSAEIAVLTQTRDDLHAQLSGLDEGRRQIEEVQRKAAEAATEYANASTRLEELQRELAAAEERLAPKAGELERVTAQVADAQDELEQVRAKAEPMRIEQAGLERQLTALRVQIADSERLISRLPELEARKAALEMAIEGLQADVESLRSEHGSLAGQLTALRGEYAGLQEQVNAAHALSGKIGALRRQTEILQQDKERAESEAASAERRCNEFAEKLDALRLELVEVRRMISELPELQGQKAALEERIEELRRQTRGPGGETPDDPVADLKLIPSCLSAFPGIDRPRETEAAALQAVCDRLAKLGLRYSRRTVKAFHTALKIGETSQMTVLAGVSGTGKSLLPRRYAEAMGVGFLQIAVEPRWDSPQDLLGFYNYVEKRYRATDLARALVQMDPYNTSGLAKQSLDDRMLLVLLDEMNLARVEYYFSEFLSRLEVRPPYAEADDPAKRRDASMPIDIRGRKEGPIHLFPSHNVLFVGTMNDDESTQALSDKVLDRGNVMQFAAPQKFAGDHDSVVPPPPGGYRRFDEWRAWVKTVKDLDQADRAKAGQIIDRLSEIMKQFGRPFGHRLNEAILTYVANYPRGLSQSLNEPLADQIEFRILPKLRGVQIDETRSEFTALCELIRDDLRDNELSDTLGALLDRQERASGQFNWRGLDRP
jgi:predicted  nucleic acid-binding Zn-ribbon protein